MADGEALEGGPHESRCGRPNRLRPPRVSLRAYTMTETIDGLAGDADRAPHRGDDRVRDDESAPDRDPVRRVEIPLSALIVLGMIVVGTILLLRAIDRTQQLVGLAIIAAIMTAVLAPAIASLQRLIGRTAATVVLHVVVLAVLAAGTGVVLQQIGAEADSLAEFTEQQIEEVDGEPSEILQQSRFDDRLGEAAASWGTHALIGDGNASGITTRVSELTIAIVLSIFFTLQGGAIVDVAVARTADRRRRRHLRAMWTAGTAAASTHLRRNLIVAVLSGAGASCLAVAFGLPAVVLVGVWAGLLSVVPLLGAIVGWAPIVVLAAIETSGATTVAIAVLAIAGVTAVNILRARFVIAPVRPGSFVIAMSIAAGITAAGIPGAIAAMFAAVAVVTALGAPRAVDDEVEANPQPEDDERSITSMALDELTGGPPRTDERRRDGNAPLVLTLSRRTTLQITALVILAFVVQLAITRAGPILVWALVGAMIAIGLDRPVSWAERRLHVKRPVIVIASAIVTTIAVAALVFTATGSFGDASPSNEDIPRLVESLSSLPVVGDALADAKLDAKIEQFRRDLPNLITRSPAAGQAVGLLSGGVVGAFWVIVAALSCLLDGPRLVAAIDRRVPAKITRQTTRLARAGKIALGGYVAGATVVAAMNGGIVLLLGLAFGVPMVALLALWAFAWNFIPQIGAIIGWAPLLLLALFESPLRGLACLAIFVVYQLIENNAIQPTIVGNAVDIGALAALGAALAGAALAGLIGAALAIPIAGVSRALYIESRREDFPPIRPRSKPTDAVRALR